MTVRKNLPFKPVPFQFNEQHVRTDKQMVCLTDLWNAAGCPKGKESPRDWRRHAGKQFVEFVGNFLNASSERIWNAKRGQGGGTFAHWQIALSYAKYLSHELHMHVNQIYMRYSMGDLELAEEVFDRTTEGVEAQRRSVARIHSKVVRNEHTQTLLEHGVREPKEFAICTNGTYQGLFGGTARQLKRQRGLRVRDNLRDDLNLIEISAVFLSEALADRQMREEDLFGVTECRNACFEQGQAVSTVI